MNREINDLLERYFNGTTTCQEEHRLRHYFSQSEIDAELTCYRPLFAGMAAMRAKSPDQASPVRSHAGKRSHFLLRYRIALGTAACLTLLIGIALTLFLPRHPDCYVIIDGHRHTNPELVRQLAIHSLQEVSYDRSDIEHNLQIEIEEP